MLFEAISFSTISSQNIKVTAGNFFLQLTFAPEFNTTRVFDTYGQVYIKQNASKLFQINAVCSQI